MKLQEALQLIRVEEKVQLHAVCSGYRISFLGQCIVYSNIKSNYAYKKKKVETLINFVNQLNINTLFGKQTQMY